MRTSPQGVAFLAAHEGVVPAPYLDSVGVWTFGIGHTASADAPIPASLPRGMPADLEAALAQVFEVFRRDLVRYEASVTAAIGRMPVTQAQFDAAISFHFNTGAIGRATWVDLWRRGDVAAAARSMLQWRTPPEILERRQAESHLFATGDYGHAQTAIWTVTTRNRPGHVIRALSAEEVIALMESQPTADLSDRLPTIRRRAKGDLVRHAQSLLGVAADGIFGRTTDAGTRSFQRRHGLKPDGIIGPRTWASISKGE